MHLTRLRHDSGVVIAVVAILFLSSCLVRSRTVAPPGHQAYRPPLTADKPELLRRLHAIADPIQSFSLKVEMSPSVGEVFGGKVNDYPTIHGFIYFQKPDKIRVIGLDPVVRSMILDMVSQGNDFKVSIPTKSLFILGSNDSPATSQNKLENLRPYAFLNSLLIEPPRADESTLLEDDTDESNARYELIFIEHVGDDLRLRRNLYFDRHSLEITSQRTFDSVGNVLSVTKYGNWTVFDRVRFPGIIDMTRPRDGYELQLLVTDFKLNPADITPEKFVLEQPPNAQVKKLP